MVRIGGRRLLLDGAAVDDDPVAAGPLGFVQ
jgi:hypothetical protein